MGNTIIQVEHLSKSYRIGLEEKRSDTLSGVFWQAIKAPINNFRTLRNLRKSTGDDQTLFWALKDINFEVKEGGVLGIIGHNGAGKSTLLKILSRITEPTDGRIKIKGRVSSLLEVGTGFHPDLTGRENIYMNGTILGMRKKEIDSKLDEIIAFSGISTHIDTPVKRYSSGMTVRLAFSVAAHLEPEILIIDEVLAVGDAEFQRKCLGKMKEVSEHNRTVIFVSHNMEAVRSLCSEAILLKNGLLEFRGEVNQVVNNYLAKVKSNLKKRDFNLTVGTEELKLISAEIISDATNILTVESTFNIRLKFKAELPIKQINLSLFLNTLSGNCIFNVGTASVDLIEGTYQSDLTIPSNLLNDDSYCVEVRFIQHTSKFLFKVEDVLSFEVVDKPREGNWFGKWEGAVRPALPFSIDKVE